MDNLWNKSETFCFDNDLDSRVYTSRLLGKDPSLVLHGGGNTSVKILEENVLGEEEEILYVKGSGLITEKGIVYNPNLKKISNLFKE